MKRITYYCPGCRGRLIREVSRAFPYYKSWCAATGGKVVRMRKLKRQPPAQGEGG